MKIILSAGGRFHALHLAHQLHKRNCLTKLLTFSYEEKDKQQIPPSYVCNMQFCAWVNYLYQKFRVNKFVDTSTFNFLKDNLFDRTVSKKIATLQRFDIFVGWANYALKSMQTARSHGAKIIIESGSSHIKAQQTLLEAEYSKWNIPNQPINHQVIEKMKQEYEQTDYIMTLSTNSRQSFIQQGIPAHKILQVPCGTDVEFFIEPPINQRKDNKFRIIFVGLLNLRKGLPYIIEAWNMLNLPEEKTELLLVGNLQKDFYYYIKNKTFKKNIVFYGSTNRSTLKKLYYQSTIFVLPSIEDGFGMVMGEAMACGLPIIATTNTGAPDVITDTVHGFLISPGSSYALAEKLLWCYEHQDACVAMGQHGKKHIRNFTWDNYGQRVYEIYQNILNAEKHNQIT